jgi:hypothetical protein
MLGACGGLKDAVDDSKQTTTALKSELGVDARVSFRTFNGRTTVAVQLAEPPSGDAAALKRNIIGIVNKKFHAKVDQVEVSF